MGSLYFAPMLIPDTPMVLLEVTSTAGCSFPHMHLANSPNLHTHIHTSLVPLRGDVAAKFKDMFGRDGTAREFCDATAVGKVPAALGHPTSLLAVLERFKEVQGVSRGGGGGSARGEH